MVSSDDSDTAVVVGENGSEIAEFDVQRHGGNEWFMDDFPCSGPATNELSERDKALVEWAVTRRCVAIKDITYYVYCTNMASWWQLESLTTANELLEQTGIRAEVNYRIALEKVYPLLSTLPNYYGICC